MKTLTRTLLLAALTAASGLFAACSKEAETPVPADPTPAFQMSTYFDFVTVTPAGGTAHSGFGTSHRPADIKSKATLNAQVLALDFAASTDNSYFELERSKMTANWVGSYSLRCHARATDPVFVSYLRRDIVAGSSSIYRLSDFTRDLTGNLTVTAYDAKRQLVSGTYEVQAPDQVDPTAPGNTTDPKCTIILAGSFENLKVQPQP